MQLQNAQKTYQMKDMDRVYILINPILWGRGAIMARMTMNGLVVSAG